MPSTPEPAFAPATVAVSAGRPPRSPDGPSNPPLVMASTYHAGGEVGYGRYGNPTWEMLESAVGALEGGVATSFASGMAAITAALDLVPLGGVVVAAPDAYYGSLAMLRRMERRAGSRCARSTFPTPPPPRQLSRAPPWCGPSPPPTRC